MIIKNIVMKNFRQYIDTKIDFSTDEVKNITVVMGDNGTGKTTLAQAFQWVLYGQTSFQIKELINRKVREDMTMGQPKTVCVSLDIVYNETDYTIKRSVTYKKNAQMKVVISDSKFSISWINENGVLTYIPEARRDYMIKQFLPKDLSKFFFFDGERIEEMSKEIQTGKSEDFKEAVYSLVGLRATQNAIMHLHAGTKNSVQKLFKHEIEKNNKSMSAMMEYDNKITRYDNVIEEIRNELKDKKNSLIQCEKKIEENQKIILLETPVMQLKKDYEKLNEEIDVLTKKREIKIGKTLLKEFNEGIFDYCARPLINEVEPQINEDGAEEKSIPDLTNRTIMHLINRGKCLCDTPLTEGSEALEAIKGLVEYAQPKTIGMQINDYKVMANFVIKHENTFRDDIKYCLKEIDEIRAQIEGNEQAAAEKMEQLGNTSKGEAAKAKKKILQAEKERLHNSIVTLEASLKNKEKERERLETEKSKLVIMNDNSIKNMRYLAYAEKLYQDLNDGYSQNENKYRVLLETRMNEIFNTIYDGNIAISIDPKYRINVTVEEENVSTDEVEKNTAQGYALIFAFISAVIDLAKRKINEDAIEEKDMIDTEKEGYPLVMDAPLSAFDKTRIKSICTEIPKIADQVIVFIKDTDGDIAEEHMSAKIGKRYMVQQVENSNLHSEVIGR